MTITDLRDRLDRALVTLARAEAGYKSACNVIPRTKEVLPLVQANKTRAYEFKREAQETVTFWTDQLNKALARARP